MKITRLQSACRMWQNCYPRACRLFNNKIAAGVYILLLIPPLFLHPLGLGYKLSLVLIDEWFNTCVRMKWISGAGLSSRRW